MAINPIFLMPDEKADFKKQAEDFIEQPIDFSYISEDDEVHHEIDDAFLSFYDPYD